SLACLAACLGLPSASASAPFPFALFAGSLGLPCALIGATARAIRGGCLRRVPLQRESAGRSAWDQFQSERLSRRRVWVGTRYMETKTQPSGSCRRSPLLPVKAASPKVRFRLWCTGCHPEPRPFPKVPLRWERPEFPRRVPIQSWHPVLLARRGSPLSSRRSRFRPRGQAHQDQRASPLQLQ